MTTYGDLFTAQRLETLDARRNQTLRSLFTLPPVTPFPTQVAEPSEQQLALQARNAPARSPGPEISTVVIDGSINRLDTLLDELTGSQRSLRFDNERAEDIRTVLESLKSDIQDRVAKAEDEFDPPALPKLEPQKISLERVEITELNAFTKGNLSLPADAKIGDLNEAGGVSISVASNNQTYTVSADADETVSDFIDRLNAKPGITARFDKLNELRIEADNGASLQVQEIGAGSFSALGLVANGEDVSGGSPVSKIDALGERIRDVVVEKVQIKRVTGDYRERLEKRNDAIEDFEQKLKTDLARLWERAQDDILAEVERSLDRGSTLLTGATTRLPSVNGAGGALSISGGDLSAEGLGLDAVDQLLEEQKYSDVFDAIDTAIGRVYAAESALSLAISRTNSEESLAENRIGRLLGERDAITDAFTAEFVAQQTGLDLRAVQLATASNRSDQLRSF